MDLQAFQEWFATQPLAGEPGELARLLRTWKYVEDAPAEIADALALIRALALMDQPMIDHILELNADTPDRFALALAAVGVQLARRAGVTL